MQILRQKLEISEDCYDIILLDFKGAKKMPGRQLDSD